MAYVLLLSALILSITTNVSTQACYNSQGLQDSSLIACGGDGGCCKIGDICYSNGLCKGSNDATSNINYYYDGCTNPNWSAPGCAPQCLNKTTVNANGMQPCAGGSNGYSDYCCLGFNLSCNCSDESILVSVPIGTVMTLLASPTSTSSISTISSMNTSSQPTTTASSSTSTSASSGTKVPGTVDAVPQQTDQQNSWLSAGVIAGIAVGAASCMLACVAAAWFLVKRQRRPEDGNNPHGPSSKSRLGEQRVSQSEGYVKPELDSHERRASQGSFGDKHIHIPEISELPSQNKAPVEVPA